MSNKQLKQIKPVNSSMDKKEIINISTENIKIMTANMEIIKSKEYILCAAIHHIEGKLQENQPKNIDKGFVICGRRHHNCFAILCLAVEERNIKSENSIQGFLTSQDRFVDRTVAMHIALRAGQIKKKQRILISEDLY